MESKRRQRARLEEEQKKEEADVSFDIFVDNEDNVASVEMILEKVTRFHWGIECR